MSSNLADLHPVFQPIARLILADAQEQITAAFPGSVIRPAVTFRTLAAQAAAKSAGLSQLSLGMHNFGLAMDVAVINANGDYVIDGTDRRYTLFGLVAKSHGTIWGGDWQHRDFDHCEAEMAGTPAELGAWMDAHRVA